MFQNLDSGELSVLIDLNQGARIASLQWRELEFSVPFRGGLFNWGWYSMAPWAGRIRNGLIKDSSGKEDRKSTRLNSSHSQQSRMPSSA